MARDLSGLTDEELLLLCRDARDGDEIRRAISTLAARHHPGVVRYLTRFLSSREAAEDLAQEAFVRIWKHAREYRGESAAKVSTWLYRIATNLALNEIRDRKNRPRVSLNVPVGAGGGEGAGELGDGIAQRREAGPGERAEARDLQSRVRRAIEELPEPYRATILLCDLEGLSYEEAAAALEVKIGTIRSRLFRAREQFQAKLGPAVVRGEI